MMITLDTLRDEHIAHMKWVAKNARALIQDWFDQFFKSNSDVAEVTLSVMDDGTGWAVAVSSVVAIERSTQVDSVLEAAWTDEFDSIVRVLIYTGEIVAKPGQPVEFKPDREMDWDAD